MSRIELTPARRKELRGDAHHLDPVVMIGNDGLTPAVQKEADLALNAHGLIKIRVFSDDRVAREAMLGQLADALNAAPVQHIGKLLVLWRPLPEKEVAPVREDRKPGPRVVKILKFSKNASQRPQIKRINVMGNQRIAAGGSLKRKETRVTSVKKKQTD
jgi:putative YhbY family RNA-binding protein